MSQDDRITNFLARNKAFAQDYTPAPPFKDMMAKGPPEKKLIIIVSCPDGRANPQKFFGLQPGEAVIISNAGGRVDSGAIRSVVVLDRLLGVGTVIVVHHTDCGLCHITDEELRTKLKVEVPEKAEEIEDMKFGEIQDPYDSVKDDVGILRASPFVRKGIEVLGYVYDITKGTVEEVR